MKINCGMSREERFILRTEWHRFFCLLPRRIRPGDCRWLEYVMRKGEYKWFGHASWGWTWEYLPLPKGGRR